MLNTIRGNDFKFTVASNISLRSLKSGKDIYYKMCIRDRIISASDARLLKDLMLGVTSYGTASDAFADCSYTIAGKTGTAEFNLSLIHIYTETCEQTSQALQGLC